ncbi:MAG: hypothetical protein COS82_07735 [Zetaproteobacteria bacterium CG06_land_8_20_14_3_00_59_53]|nr:MAG: hypothetical protein AUK36_10425 [Zetaproteobacteria bacterium CG2_30_59_37]PIO90334.1 MAG: hypothetical protein COX56_02910 [Zetaproteobacteria bacterium CG23_combo_of_CG06-09_8_20_14_all_59_86]PIQ65100.1 MAG: hypothetical protein COV97_05885 [Zetaproteobacteria bacterium CG11_big_fil_rev_8_21_14_0_20_59_439]PIU70148.1 MAG: hypothetical protein COS82_07735 [Zetaproteobacteria bacterium CG06_land_8_20_14_3_00_59_53]PIU96119.1 MAG: hypothetical protein COS62_10360 [Zetaproteobacteria bac
MNRYLLTFVIAAALPLMNGCATLMSSVEPPDVHVLNITPLESEGVFEQRVRLDLRVINPNDFALMISGFSFRLDVNDARFASGVSNEAISVPRLGEAKTSVVVTTSMLDVFRQVMGLADRETLDYAINGKVYFANPGMRSVSFSHKASLSEGKAN